MDIDSRLLDKAICYAVRAHSGVARRGKGFPYVVHPMEAVAIVATMSEDQELLAAAALHDVVEDTETTIEDIRREFGERVARLVDNETEKPVAGKSEKASWHERRLAAIERLAHCDRDSKIVALGDKLSNMRQIYRDYKVVGSELWNRFHETDPREHAWHYRGLLNSLGELRGTEAFAEFERLVNEVFTESGNI